MPEYIDREQLDKAYLMLGYGEEELPRRMLQMMPAEEVAKVVRCKDCRWAKPYERTDGKQDITAISAVTHSNMERIGSVYLIRQKRQTISVPAEKGEPMNNLDVAGILQTYSQKARLAKSTKQLRCIVSDLKLELDLRKIKIESED